MTRLRLSVAALLCLISSGAWADLRTYDVDFQDRNEVYSALRNLLWATTETIRVGNTYGRVELLPSGQILVNADPETLEQVDRLLRELRDRPVAATPRVTLRYWAVLGTRAPSNATTGGQQGVTVTVVGAPNAPSAGPPPAALNGVLAELKRFHGDLTFRVLGTAAVVSQSGQGGQVEGTPLSVNQIAHVQGDTLNAELRITLAPVGELEVQTALKRGEFVVLGEASRQGFGVDDGTLFYIVHWPE
jgi:hypothetical protein